ncbi:MAG TPA: aminoglycoside phosphotransferase family protein, partial [Solirubrobacteraceae bacterium]
QHATARHADDVLLDHRPDRKRSLGRNSQTVGVSTIRIPPLLTDEARPPGFQEWLAALPEIVEELASGWGLELDDPYLPGGYCAWVAPARDTSGEELVLKIDWLGHWEGEHEGQGLTHWNGDGAVRCFATRELGPARGLLLERCTPGARLKCSVPETEQDVVVAGLMRRLWSHGLAEDHSFRSLQEMCERWAHSFEVYVEEDSRGFDPGLAREGISLLRELPSTAERTVLLCTDLHGDNILASRREPWLAIDPKPFVGDPAYDTVQHMLNCDERLATDPVGLSARMAELAGVDPERVRLWLFARCAQESPDDQSMREPARRLAPA